MQSPHTLTASPCVSEYVDIGHGLDVQRKLLVIAGGSELDVVPSLPYAAELVGDLLLGKLAESHGDVSDIDEHTLVLILPQIG